MSKPEDYRSGRKPSGATSTPRPAVPTALNTAVTAISLRYIGRENFQAAGVLELLELASAGGYGIMFGFNRTGGVVAMLFAGGEKTRAHLEEGVGLATWVRNAEEFLLADFGVERPKAKQQYLDSLKAREEA